MKLSQIRYFLDEFLGKKFKFQFLGETKTKTNVNRNRNGTFIFLSTKPRKLSLHHASAPVGAGGSAITQKGYKVQIIMFLFDLTCQYWLGLEHQAGMGSSKWSLCSFFIDFSAWAEHADGPNGHLGWKENIIL